MQESAIAEVHPIHRSALRTRPGLARILVVDDEPDACEVIQQLLVRRGYDATPETSPSGALRKLASEDFDLVLTDVSMVEMSGLDLCRRIVEKRPGMPVVLVTGRGNMNTLVEALRVGASDYLTKPIDETSLFGSVTHALGRRALAKGNTRVPEEAAVPSEDPAIAKAMLGESLPIRHVRQLITDLSGSPVSVLLQGETGTGKEIVAHAIHDNSPFRAGPFVALNCAAMPAGLLESELFGHARGAFTDARTATKGLLLQAHGGTLLLDEIGELPLTMQPKLLRALQERKVRPVGGAEETSFDCRIITATNRDLDAEVSASRFREDLYYRINVVRIVVPPLRERGQDVLLLAQHFLDAFARNSRRKVSLSEPVIRRLLAYSWPGNVRELENCIERAVALSRFEQLTIQDLPEKIQCFAPEFAIADEPSRPRDPAVLSLVELERRYILRAMKVFNGNQTLASGALGIDRRTLYRRLKEYESPGATALGYGPQR